MKLGCLQKGRCSRRQTGSLGSCSAGLRPHPHPDFWVSFLSGQVTALS